MSRPLSSIWCSVWSMNPSPPSTTTAVGFLSGTQSSIPARVPARSLLGRSPCDAASARHHEIVPDSHFQCLPCRPGGLQSAQTYGLAILATDRLFQEGIPNRAMPRAPIMPSQPVQPLPYDRDALTGLAGPGCPRPAFRLVPSGGKCG